MELFKIELLVGETFDIVIYNIKYFNFEKNTQKKLFIHFLNFCQNFVYFFRNFCGRQILNFQGRLANMDFAVSILAASVPVHSAEFHTTAVLISCTAKQVVAFTTVTWNSDFSRCNTSMGGGNFRSHL